MTDDDQLDVFACDDDDIDESAGMRERVYQLTELPGETFEEIFGDAA